MDETIQHITIEEYNNIIDPKEKNQKRRFLSPEDYKKITKIEKVLFYKEYYLLNKVKLDSNAKKLTRCELCDYECEQGNIYRHKKSLKHLQLLGHDIQRKTGPRKIYQKSDECEEINKLKLQNRDLKKYYNNIEKVKNLIEEKKNNLQNQNTEEIENIKTLLKSINY